MAPCLRQVSATTSHDPHVLRFSAEDEVGLRGEGRTARIIDGMRPNAPLLLQPAGEVTMISRQVAVVGLAEPLATVVLFLNDTPLQTVSIPAADPVVLFGRGNTVTSSVQRHSDLPALFGDSFSVCYTCQ